MMRGFLPIQFDSCRRGFAPSSEQPGPLIPLIPFQVVGMIRPKGKRMKRVIGRPSRWTIVIAGGQVIPSRARREIASRIDEQIVLIAGVGQIRLTKRPNASPLRA